MEEETAESVLTDLQRAIRNCHQYCSVRAENAGFADHRIKRTVQHLTDALNESGIRETDPEEEKPEPVVEDTPDAAADTTGSDESPDKPEDTNSDSDNDEGDASANGEAETDADSQSGDGGDSAPSQ